MSHRRFLLSRLVKNEIENLRSSLRFETALEEECKILASTGFRVPDKDGKPASNPTAIDRRKLDRIAAGDDGVNLHLWELRLLASYFERKYGVDLTETPVFEKVNIYEPLTSGGKVCFLFGMRPEATEKANSLRLWDLRSMTVIAEEVYQTRHRVELDWQFIEPTPAKNLEDKSDEWNLISIGSPRANVATEILLSRMFGVTPFQTMTPRADPILPFSFVWSQPVQSAFAATDTALQAHAVAAEYTALKTGNASGMLINGRAHVVDNSYTTALIPGVIAAQRMANQKIVVVVAGLSGPATFGAAKLLKEFTAELPPASSDPASTGVLWAAVGVTVSAKPGAPGDPRVPDKWEFLTVPEIWKPSARP